MRLTIALAICCVAAHAHSAQLFEPVDSPAIMERLESHSAEFLAKVRYVARRDRLVTINEPALRGDRPLTVTLFDGVPELTIAHDDSLEASAPNGRIWRGRIVSPTFPEVIESHPYSDEELRTYLNYAEHVTTIELYVHSWDTNIQTGRAAMTSERRTATPARDAVQVPKRPLWTEDAFVSVRGEFDLHWLGLSTFRLIPIKNAPKYHILVELDDSKLPAITDTPGEEEHLDPNLKLVNEAYTDAMEDIEIRLEDEDAIVGEFNQ